MGKKALSQEEFISRSNALHGNRFSYDDLRYVNARTPITLSCSLHGVFIANPATHLRGVNSCRGCNGQEPMNLDRAWSILEEKFQGNIVIISITPIENMRSTIEVKCVVHGVKFTTVIRSLLQGKNGCHQCQPSGKRMSLEQFLHRAKKVHGDHYSYDAITDLPRVHEKVEIMCRKHDYSFIQSVDNHLSGRQGCLPCATSTRSSQGEEELALYVESLGYMVKRGDRGVLQGREIDVLIPSLSLGFEYNGEYWHSDPVVRKNTGMGADEYHAMKAELASMAGVDLHFIWERQWRDEPDKMKYLIEQLLLDRSMNRG